MTPTVAKKKANFGYLKHVTPGILVGENPFVNTHKPGIIGGFLVFPLY